MENNKPETITQRLDLLDNLGKDYTLRLKSGDVFGFSTGFQVLDDSIGRIEPNTLTVIGGYTGTGKSYFMANMINGMLNDEYKIPKILVFSSELSEFDYIRRFVLMRCGIYKIQLQTKSEYQAQYIESFDNAYKNFIMDMRLDPYALQVIKIRNYNEIEEWFKTAEYKPDIIFIDWLQQLSYVVNKDKTIFDEKESMPIISAKLDALRSDQKFAIVAFSQINNYMSNADFMTNQLNPFSFGKQIAQTCDNSMIITRERFAGQKSPLLTGNILKGREGSGEPVNFSIENGFNLHAVSAFEATRITARWKEGLPNG